jgi:hypothetical protein
MHNELRYQAKKHAISEKLSKERNKVPHLLPIFFLLKTDKQKNNKHMLRKGNDIKSQHVR